MALTVGDILNVPGLALRLIAGQANVGRPIRWVHISELEDPTPWLKGGEILLTTGNGVGATPARQRGYLDRKSTRLNSSHSRASRMPSSA